MANRTLEVDCPQGLTLTAELFTPGADTVVASVALTERTNDKGCYTGTIASITGGLYRIRIKSGTTTIARGILRHTDATGVERPDDVDGILSATHGTGQWDAVGSGGGGSGGTNSLSVTVTDASGGAPIPNAQVDLFSGSVLIDTQTADTEGQCTVHGDPGTYTLITTSTDYASVEQSVTLPDDTTASPALTRLTVSPPAEPAQCNVQIRCVDANGVKKSGVVVTALFQHGPDGGTGVAYDDDSTASGTSDANGIATIALPRLATYEFMRAGRKGYIYTVPDASTAVIPWIAGP